MTHSNDFINVDKDNLPEPFKLVWLKRKKGEVYIGYRNEKPFATNPDLSQECHWFGTTFDKMRVEGSYGKLKLGNNFSDLTVECWSEITFPQ